MTDVWITVIFGVLGFWLQRLKYPVAPLVVALVLGDSTEKVLRQSLIMSGAGAAIFFTRPISGVLMLIAIALFLVPLAQRLAAFLKQRQGAGVAIP